VSRAGGIPVLQGGEDVKLPQLQADCARCAALCCVAPGFSASADFAIDKAPGQPCPHLDAGFRCSIHDQLRPRGFPGCASYDCFGAGQHVIQGTFGGQDWRQAPALAGEMFAAFAVMRPLHELLWYLTQAQALTAAAPVHDALAAAAAEITRRTHGRPGELAGLDLDAVRAHAAALLRRASELARGEISTERDLSGAGLIGGDLRGRDLRRASLRGAALVGADLTGADLRGADFTGADLRGADLSGADLGGALFLTQAQLDAARGDAATRLPPPLRVPRYWPGADGRLPRRWTVTGSPRWPAGPTERATGTDEPFRTRRPTPSRPRAGLPGSPPRPRWPRGQRVQGQRARGQGARGWPPPGESRAPRDSGARWRAGAR